MKKDISLSSQHRVSWERAPFRSGRRKWTGGLHGDHQFHPEGEDAERGDRHRLLFFRLAPGNYRNIKKLVAFCLGEDFRSPLQDVVHGG